MKMSVDKLENYLANRQQCTKVNCTILNLESIFCGVQQGSVLGPKLFLVYVNDMAKYLNSVGHYLYADDAVLFHAMLNNL